MKELGPISNEEHTCSNQAIIEVEEFTPLSIRSEMGETFLSDEHMLRNDAEYVDGSMGQTMTDMEIVEDKEQTTHEPCVGMEFSSHEEAYDFYNSYARVNGFGIRKGHTALSTKKDMIVSREFLCDKEGYKNMKDKRQEGKSISRRADTRVGCKARLVIGFVKDTEKWRIRFFEGNHNGHSLTTPSKVMKHHSHQTLHRTSSCKKLIDALDDKGIRPTTICKVVNVACGSEEGSLTRDQCQSHLRRSHQNNIGQECMQIIDYFQNNHAADPEFYFAIQLDHDRTVRSIFWANGRARLSYLQFRDVISFDCTYRTNKLRMPFAPFTGVNHHRQSSLFGCALLADETEETFTWLFTEWLKCMSGIAPSTIITDQDKAMCPAIHKVFPHTRHRFCSWHLQRNAIQNLQPMQKVHGEEVVAEYYKWYWSSTSENFEKRWEELKERYKLDERSWMSILYNQKEHWVPLFLKDTFTAGMTSTQRSESINAYFDGYVNAQTELHDFVKQYEDAVATRRAAENDANFRSANSIPVLTTLHRFEEQGRDRYTRKVFDIFQEECRHEALMLHEKVSKADSIIEYAVWSVKEDKDKRKDHVFFHKLDDEVSISCTCAKFEMEGILCRHCLHILIKKQEKSIPEKYIMRRWTKEAKYVGHGVDRSCMTNNEQISILKHWELRAKCNKALNEALSSEEFQKEFEEMIDNFMKKVEVRKKEKEAKEKEAVGIAESSNVVPLVTISLTQEQATHITIRDPSGPMKTKGRPMQATRIKSGIEIAQEKEVGKKRKCGYCSERGHYTTSCPVKKQHEEASGKGNIGN